MIPFLTAPLALLGLACVPLLVAVYLFHRRPRSLQVSSLMLWAALRRPEGGGRRTEPPRLPLTFWLELLALLLLIAAAAGPLVPWLSRRRPLIVILDDSLSMQAGHNGDTARQRAYEFITHEISSGAYDPIRFVFAGTTPQLAGPAVSSHTAASAQLDRWSCSSTGADMDAAQALATQLGERNALILIVSDRAPVRKMGSRVRWCAFGRAEPNLAFVAATRRSNGPQDRVVFEIANESNRPASTAITIASGTRVLHKQRLALSASERRNVTFDLSLMGDVEAWIDDDAASFDNRVTLLSDRRAPVRIALDIANERLRDDVERAAGATGRAVVTPGGDVLITDRAQPAAAPWILQFIQGPSGVSRTGPFLLDRTHPLTEGLTLDAVIWTAARGPLPGSPVILSGRDSLLADETLPSGGHHLRLRLDPALSNLQKSPAWPALIWNLIEWRSSIRPGFHDANVVLGSNAELAIGPLISEVRIAAPGGVTRTIAAPVGTRTMPISASRPGVWSASAGGETWRFASNALVPQESDLSGAGTGTKSAWSEDALLSGGYQNIAPLVLLAALALLAAHQRVTFKAAA